MLEFSDALNLVKREIGHDLVDFDDIAIATVEKLRGRVLCFIKSNQKISTFTQRTLSACRPIRSTRYGSLSVQAKIPSRTIRTG